MNVYLDIPNFQTARLVDSLIRRASGEVGCTNLLENNLIV